VSELYTYQILSRRSSISVSIADVRNEWSCASGPLVFLHGINKPNSIFSGKLISPRK